MISDQVGWVSGQITYLVVNSLIQVLDEDITLSGFAESRIALRPHDAAARG